MHPQNTANLDRFLEAYARSGTYILAPLPFGPSAGLKSINLGIGITKRRLIVRDAWTIGENEPELICIHDDDVPVIPGGVSDPPISRALERLRKMRQQRSYNESIDV